MQKAQTQGRQKYLLTDPEIRAIIKSTGNTDRRLSLRFFSYKKVTANFWSVAVTFLRLSML